MKLSLTFVTAALCVSVPAVQAGKNDCLVSKRYNVESVCRTECTKVNAVAFSVSYDETNDACRCYGSVEDLGVYIGSGDRDSKLTCYSMESGEKTKLLDFGDCIIDYQYAEAYSMPKCEGDCLDREVLCRDECAKHNFFVFAVSYAKDDNACRCYPDTGIISTHRDVDVQSNPWSCYSAMDGSKIRLLGYGECIAEKLDETVVPQHTTVVKRCQEPQVEKFLRGSVSD